jgi:uncharacterized protein (TIGR02597 family)
MLGNTLGPVSRLLCLFVALLFGAANFTSAQVTVATDPVGFTTTTLLGSPSSAVDSFVSIPFTRPPEFIGGIASTTATTITVSGTPLIASQFKYVQGSQPKHYYVLIGPGAGTKEGHTYAITDNTNNSLTVMASALDDASGIPANTQIEVIPYWTPATIFPASDLGTSFTATASPPTYQTLLRVPDYNAASYLALPAAEYYFSGNASTGHWQRVTPAGVGDDDPLLPDGYFVVRNATGVSSGSLTNIGTVLLKKLAVPLIAQGSQTQDNPVSMVRPVLDLPTIPSAPMISFCCLIIQPLASIRRRALLTPMTLIGGEREMPLYLIAEPISLPRALGSLFARSPEG